MLLLWMRSDSVGEPRWQLGPGHLVPTDHLVTKGLARHDRQRVRTPYEKLVFIARATAYRSFTSR